MYYLLSPFIHSETQLSLIPQPLFISSTPTGIFCIQPITMYFCIILYNPIPYRIQMQERQKIQQELQRLREECVRDYLQDKLQQITSKEVIHDILQQFLQAHNQEFFANIADNIQQAKQQNRALREQLEVVKQQGEVKLQQAIQAILHESQQRSKEEVQAVSHRFQAEIAQLQAKITWLFEAKVALEEQRQQLIVSQNSLQTESQQIEVLRNQLAQNKRSFANFKESCERIIYEGNRQKEREKQRMMDEWNCIRQDLEAQIKTQLEGQALQQELIVHKSEMEAKEVEIRQTDKQLRELLVKQQEMKHLCAQITTQLQESKARQHDLTEQIANLTRAFESNELSMNYLKEENSYLREEIISFSSRYEKLENEKAILTRTASQYKHTLNKRTEEYQRTQQTQQQQFMLKMDSYKHQYETTIAETLQELSKLKQEIQSYHQINAEKEQCFTSVTQENAVLVQANLFLQEQVNNKISQIERQEAQLQQYESELINLRRQCRSEIQAMKQTLDANWNSKNEQLIEQQFINHQLKEQISQHQFAISQLKQEIASLHHDISVRDEKQHYYKMVTEQIRALQKKYSPEKTDEIVKDNTFRFMKKQNKIYFIVSKMQKEISRLKSTNEELRAFVLRSFGEFSASFQQSTAYNIAKVIPATQKAYQASYNQVNLKKNVQMKLLIRQKQTSSSSKLQQILDKKQQVFNRTVQQRVNPQPASPNTSNNFTQIKKALKNIQQRYQSVQQENKFYNTHLDTYIKQA